MLFPNTTPERKWIAEWGASEEYMAGLYSSFNATVSASGMEGFNVPFLESLACETPAVGIAQPSYDWSDQIIQARSNAWDEIIPFSYVFESSPEAFAVCMDKALKYKVDREKLMHLTWNSVAKKFNSIIEKV